MEEGKRCVKTILQSTLVPTINSRIRAISEWSARDIVSSRFRCFEDHKAIPRSFFEQIIHILLRHSGGKLKEWSSDIQTRSNLWTLQTRNRCNINHQSISTLATLDRSSTHWPNDTWLLSSTVSDNYEPYAYISKDSIQTVRSRHHRSWPITRFGRSEENHPCGSLKLSGTIELMKSSGVHVQFIETIWYDTRLRRWQLMTTMVTSRTII